MNSRSGGDEYESSYLLQGTDNQNVVAQSTGALVTAKSIWGLPLLRPVLSEVEG